MKKYYFLLSTILFVSCNLINSSNKVQHKNSVLNDSILPQQFFSINIDSSSNLVTKNGCVIHIPSGAIECNTKNIKLEIREAINIEDIVKAGLFTKSYNEILSSKGMIYINSSKEYSIKMKKGIKVFMPSESYDKNIQLFKGETNQEGKKNWTNPKPLIKNKLQSEIELGEKLFTQHCSTCHKLQEKITGPPLLYCYVRSHGDYFYQFVQNPSRIIASGDVYANCLFNQYSKTIMTSFENVLKKKEVSSIYNYIVNESEKHPELKTKYSSNCCDSCIIYEEALQKINQENEKLIRKNPPKDFFNINYSAPVFPVGDIVLPQATNDSLKNAIVEIASTKSLYYEFTINAPGWYNLDIYLKAYENELSNSYLAVKVNGEKNEENTSVSLIIPSKKTMVEGGKMDDNIKYAFDEKSGKIKLTLGEKAYIMATIEKSGKLYFDLVEFTVSNSQTIEINLKESTKNEILQAIQTMSLENVKAEIKENPNKKKLLKMKEKLEAIEKLKPHNCSCSLEAEMK